MKKEPLIFMSALGLVGYITFHGHLKNQDCWLCPYKGIVFAGSSIALGTYLAFTETE
jgi:hypothetical protein